VSVARLPRRRPVGTGQGRRWLAALFCHVPTAGRSSRDGLKLRKIVLDPLNMQAILGVPVLETDGRRQFGVLPQPPSWEPVVGEWHQAGVGGKRMSPYGRSGWEDAEGWKSLAEAVSAVPGRTTAAASVWVAGCGWPTTVSAAWRWCGGRTVGSQRSGGRPCGQGHSRRLCGRPPGRK